MGIDKKELTAIAKDAMQERDLWVKHSKEALTQVENLSTTENFTDNYKDLTHFHWISIDNVTSLDLDQLTYAEIKNGQRIVYVAIADVEQLLKKDTPVDSYAAHNTTSIYTPTIVFPMLPPKLSTNLTSLNPHVERGAVVVEMEVDETGSIQLREIYPAKVFNQEKLAYPKVSDFLEGKASYSTPKTIEQLKLQDQISQDISQYRDTLGNLHFASLEIEADVEGKDASLKTVETDRGHTLIENLMIAANISLTAFMKKHGLPVLQRVVKTPRRWDRIVEIAKNMGTTLPKIPDSKALQEFLQIQAQRDPLRFPDLSLTLIKLIGKGEYIYTSGSASYEHFDLGLKNYAHTTAPNRRFPDLVMQRLLKSYFLKKNLPYSPQELAGIANHCTAKEDDAKKVERQVKKSAAAMLLEPLIGKTFKGIVTGASNKGTWVRIFNPPIEGKVVDGFLGLDVGDLIHVKLIQVNVSKGYIDFIKI